LQYSLLPLLSEHKTCKELRKNTKCSWQYKSTPYMGPPIALK
jgi:hypothetical protein